MKKINILLSFCILNILLCNLNSLNAQNLIRNGDFEQGYPHATTKFMYLVDSNTIINTDTVVNGCDYWICNDYAQTSRFVHNAPHWAHGLTYDNINAHSGLGYLVFNGNDGANTTLDSSLIAGHKYKLEYYICIDSMLYFYGISQGFTPYTQMIFLFNNGGNVFYSPTFTYTGFGAWKKYDTVFTALANSTSLRFTGNDTNGLGPQPCTIVIYMDDISLRETTNEAIEENSFNSTPPTIVLNQENNILSVSINNNLLNTIIIYNSLGQCIFNSLIKKEKAEIPMIKQSSGIYYIKIISNNSTFTKTIILTKTK